MHTKSVIWFWAQEKKRWTDYIDINRKDCNLTEANDVYFLFCLEIRETLDKASCEIKTKNIKVSCGVTQKKNDRFWLAILWYVS